MHSVSSLRRCKFDISVQNCKSNNFISYSYPYVLMEVDEGHVMLRLVRGTVFAFLLYIKICIAVTNTVVNEA